MSITDALPKYTTWDVAVYTAYERACAKYDEHKDRIRRGALLAAERGSVLEPADGPASVISSDGRTRYAVQGCQCSCPDPVRLCKHVWAVQITRKAEGIHAAMRAQDAQWVATDARTGESGIVHAVGGHTVDPDGTLQPVGPLFLVPYGGPHGYYIDRVHVVLGQSLLACVPA